MASISMDLASWAKLPVVMLPTEFGPVSALTESTLIDVRKRIH